MDLPFKRKPRKRKYWASEIYVLAELAFHLHGGYSAYAKANRKLKDCVNRFITNTPSSERFKLAALLAHPDPIQLIEVRNALFAEFGDVGADQGDAS